MDQTMMTTDKQKETHMKKVKQYPLVPSTFVCARCGAVITGELGDDGMIHIEPCGECGKEK